MSAFGPDITAIPADAALVIAEEAEYGSFGTFGPPIFAATHVIDEAIASVCKAGQTPSRSNVLAAIKQTNESTSILGEPISFDSHGDNAHGKFFLFKIDSARQVPADPRLTDAKSKNAAERLVLLAPAIAPAGTAARAADGPASYEFLFPGTG